MGVRGAFRWDLAFDRDSAGFIDAEFGSFDEVGEVCLEERLPFPPSDVAECRAGFGCGVAEQLCERPEHRYPVLVVGLSRQPGGEAFGGELGPGESPKDRDQPVSDRLDRSWGEVGGDNVKLVEDVLDRTGPAAPGELVNLILHFRCTCLPRGPAYRRAAGGADVLDQFPGRTGQVEAIGHRHVSRQRAGAPPWGDGNARQHEVGLTGGIGVCDKDPPFDRLAAGDGGAVAQHATWPEHRDDPGSVVADGVLERQRRADDVHAGRDPKCRACLGLAGEPGLVLRGRDHESPGRVLPLTLGNLSGLIGSMIHHWRNLRVAIRRQKQL